MTKATAAVFVFIAPALHGAGYLVTTAGLAIVAAALGLAIYRMITDAPAVIRHHRTTPPRSIKLKSK